MLTLYVGEHLALFAYARNISKPHVSCLWTPDGEWYLANQPNGADHALQLIFQILVGIISKLTCQLAFMRY